MFGKKWKKAAAVLLGAVTMASITLPTPLM